MERVTRSFGRMMGDDQYNRASDTVREPQELSAGVGEPQGPPTIRSKSERIKGGTFF